MKPFTQGFFRRIGVLHFAMTIGVVAGVFGVAKEVYAAPVISNVSTTAITTGSAQIIWTTNAVATSYVEYGTSVAYGKVVSDSALVASHSLSFAGLTPGTVYYYRVHSTDGGGETISSGYQFTTKNLPVISDVHIAAVGETYADISWRTDVIAYPSVLYGTNDQYNLGFVGSDVPGMIHTLRISGLSSGATYYFKPRVLDAYGNTVTYVDDNTFTTSAPYLVSLSTTKVAGTYGPGAVISLTATYSEALTSGSVTLTLNNNTVPITLSSVSGDTIIGQYTIGATGSGEDTSRLKVSQINAQNVCGVQHCYSGTSMPDTGSNIDSNAVIAIDTTAPVFSGVLPATSAYINSVTGSYTLSEAFGSAMITITRTGGNSDSGSPHVCVLRGSSLSLGSHFNFDTANCQAGTISLVDGTVYSFAFSGQDLYGNSAATVTNTGITFDTSVPQLLSFTSTSPDQVYGPSTLINITANYNENVGGNIIVTLNTGAQVLLDTVSGRSISGIYHVGAVGSGQNTSDLNVSGINGQSVFDAANNSNHSTTLPVGNNLGDNADIKVDTNAATSNIATTFLTNPINSTNVAHVGLRVTISGDSGADYTIYYSIDDQVSPGTPAIQGNIPMDVGGSTDITNLNLSSLNDGIVTASVYLKKTNGQQSNTVQTTVVKDTINPVAALAYYYADAELTTPITTNTNPRIGEGQTYYVAIGFDEALQSTPTLSIDAEGTANDISNVPMTFLSGNTFEYKRTIVYDAASFGNTIENISVTATDAHGNTAANIDSVHESDRAGYIDTIKPTISSSLADPAYAKSGTTVNLSLNFDEPMNTSVSPAVRLVKNGGSTLTFLDNAGFSHGYYSATQWRGYVTISAGDSNGVATIDVLSAKDIAGNVLNMAGGVANIFIDTVNPSINVNDGTSGSPVRTDTINLVINDVSPSSGIFSAFYGFSSDATCNASDTIDQVFTSGGNFSITGNHTDYLCSKVMDNAGNIGYMLIGQLNVDNAPPTIVSVNSIPSPKHYKAGDTVPINVNFSEVVSGSGTVMLETGTTDRQCSFTVTSSSTVSCQYVVQPGDTSSRLSVNSIAPNPSIADIAGNGMVNFVPVSNLNQTSNVIIDTTAPVLHLISPVTGNAVNGSATISFSDSETTNAECSYDNITWTSCFSGVTTLANVSGWNGLSDGPFTLYVRDTDLAGNIGSDSRSGVIRDTVRPTVVNVTSNTPDGAYNAGKIIDIQVTFSRSVRGSGIVTLGTTPMQRTCSFSLGSSSTMASCNYTVLSGDTADVLSVVSVGGSLQDDVGNVLTATTPEKNLSDDPNNKHITIDTTAPLITSVSSTENGTFGAGSQIPIDFQFSEVMTGDLVVNFDSGGQCFFSISNASSGQCVYTVNEGDISPDLTTIGISGAAMDAAQNSMTNFVPVATLAQNNAIVIDTTPGGPPHVVSVTANVASGSYKQGTAIDIGVIFSEPVSTVGDVTVTFNTNPDKRICTFSIAASSHGNMGSCTYIVQEGDTALPLGVESVTGVVLDTVNNPMTETVPYENLSPTKTIIIDTTPPAAPTIAFTNPVTDANKTQASFTGTGEANAVVTYTIDDGNSLTNPKTGTGTVDTNGNINITSIDVTGLDGGTLTATATLTDAAGNVGNPGTVTVTSQIILPHIVSVTTEPNSPNGYYNAGKFIDVRVNFSESVVSSGGVTVTFETGSIDESCSFVVSNQNYGVCRYTVLSGNNSSDLDATVSGSIVDMAGNPMISFIPDTTLAQNRDIIIDTTPPAAPTIAFTNPVTDANKTQASFTGTGEVNAVVTYTIDDGNSLTNPKTGTGTVDTNGNINITSIDVTGLDGGTLTATATLTDAAGNVGNPGTVTVTSQIILPHIVSITSNPSAGHFSDSSPPIDVIVTFSETVVSSSDVTVNLSTGITNGKCTFTLSNQTVGGCQYQVQPGDSSPDLDATVSGGIVDMAGNPMLRFIPDTTLAQNSDLVLDTVKPVLVSLTSSSENRTYGPRESIDIVATYSKDIMNSSSLAILLNTGATITLDTVAQGKELRGTYVVGAPGSGEGTSDLTASSLVSQNVCDVATNCLTDRNLPGTNIATHSNIAIDAVSPVFSDVLPENSSNIGSVHAASDISYTLSENLASGSITVTRTAWATDSNSPHVCALAGNDLLAGSHAHFDVGACGSGDFNLVSGAVYTFIFSGQDSFGNMANDVVRTGVSFGLDNVPPEVTSVRVESVTTSSAVVRWDTSENANALVDFGTTLSYGDIRGDSFAQSTSHLVQLTGLTPSTRYYFKVRSSDASGNEGIGDNNGAGFEFTTLLIPTVTSISAGDVTSQSATITWAISDMVYSYVSYGETESYGISLGDESIPLDTQTVLLTNLKPNQTYYYRVKFRDSFGNVGYSERMSFKTEPDTSDKQPPVITNVLSGNITNASATMTWNTDELATSYVEYGTSTQYGETYGNGAMQTNHLVTLPATLTKSTIYHFRVISADSNGNASTSEDYTFTTKEKSEEAIQNGGGSISGITVANKSSSGVTIEWKTSTPTNGFVRYGLNNKYGQVAGEDVTIEATANYAKNHSVILDNLLSHSKYYFRVVSMDVTGNILISSEGTFTTNELSSISGVTVGNVSLSSATITWETADPTSTLLDYGLTPIYGKTYENNKLENAHRVELTGLSSGQTYHFRVRGNTKKSGLVFSDDYVFATFLQPKIDRFTLGTITDASADLRWSTNIPTETSVEYWKKDAPDNKGTQGLSDTVTDHTIALGGLEQGTEYEIRVKGIDVNKNTFESDIYSFTTAIDLTPPQISGVSSKAMLASQSQDLVQGVISWKTDEPATSQILLDSGLEQDATIQESKIDENLTTNHILVITDLRLGMVYRFRVVSLDKNKNKSESKMYTVLTPKKEKSVFQLIFSNFEQTFGWIKKF